MTFPAKYFFLPRLYITLASQTINMKKITIAIVVLFLALSVNAQILSKQNFGDTVLANIIYSNVSVSPWDMGLYNRLNTGGLSSIASRLERVQSGVIRLICFQTDLDSIKKAIEMAWDGKKSEMVIDGVKIKIDCIKAPFTAKVVRMVFNDRQAFVMTRAQSDSFLKDF